MTFEELFKKAKSHLEKTGKCYVLTEEDILSVCIDDNHFIETPEFWDSDDSTHNRDIIDKLEKEKYLVRSDRTDRPDKLNPAYVYYVVK